MKEEQDIMDEIEKEVDSWSPRIKRNMEYLINDDYYLDNLTNKMVLYLLEQFERTRSNKGKHESN